MTEDYSFMARAIQLAKNGLGSTAPNPMVGAVIVHNKKIIGEGFTSPYGGPHAEVNAIQSVADTSLLKLATLYVTLEPCSHFGKTPPCANLIIEYKIPRIVIGVLDSNEKVAGQGVSKLKNAGCKVVIGVMEKECTAHHKRFLTFHQKKRPYIILKWAETQDGFIAPKKEKRNTKPEPYWITNSYSRQIVHQWRFEEQAILVGTNTVLEDNPKLDARKWKGKHPLRVILDRDLKIQGDYHILDGSISTLIFTNITNTSQYKKGIAYVILDFSKDLVQRILDTLHEKNITSILIEGGSQTLQTFIDSDLWDEARVFTSQNSFKEGINAPKISGTLVHSQKIGNNTLKLYSND